MTKKHFIAIAADIRHRMDRAESTADECLIDSLAYDLAATFEGFNPNFDRTKFLAACGVDPS